MRRLGFWGAALLLVACAAWLVGGHITAIAQDKEAEKAEEHAYVGASACKMCHKSAKKGEQYKKWLNSPHAKAYDTLKSVQSRQLMLTLGLEGLPTEHDKCLKCHVTAHGVKPALLEKGYSIEEGVSCESCHGPASDWKKPHMRDREAAVKAGLRDPGNPEMCKTCHNPESPTYKEFVYEEKLAVIAHPNPNKKK